MDNFNYKKFLVENKLTINSRLLNETLNFVNSGELDTDLIKKTIKDNYESFESSMSMEEFNTYLDAYIEDAAHSVGADEEAYNNVPLSDLLDDFKTYVQYTEDLNENISKFDDYISGMFDMSVDEEEGSQTGVWKKEEYASDAYEGTDFSDLSNYLGSVDGKATLEGNPDITVELLDSGDIKWSADVTLDEDLNEVSSDDLDNPESPLARLNDGPDADVLNNITEKYGKDVVLHWLTSGNYPG